MFPHNLFALAPRAKMVRESKGHAVGGASFRRGGRCASSFFSTSSSLAAAALVFGSIAFASDGAQAMVASTTPAASGSAGQSIAKRTALPGTQSGTRGAALAEADGVLFLTGGDVKGALSGHVDKYDPATGEWTRLTDRVVPRSFGGAVVQGDWLVIVGGRSDVGAEPMTELVHIDTGEVLVGAPLPSPRWNAGVAVHNGLVFVAGGTHGWARLDVVEAYDIDDDRWLVGPALNVARDASLVDIDGSLFAIGGYGGKGVGPTRVVERLDDDTGRFVVAGALAMPMSAFAIAAIDGQAVLFGDFASASRVVAFTPKTGRTTLVQTMFTPRRQAAAVATEDGIVVAGGRLDSGALSTTVERFTFR